MQIMLKALEGSHGILSAELREYNSSCCLPWSWTPFREGRGHPVNGAQHQGIRPLLFTEKEELITDFFFCV